MVLVVQRDVINQVLVFAPHLLDAVLDDVGNFVGKGGIPTDHCRIRSPNQQGVAVLVLKTFTIQRSATGCGTEEKASSSGVGGLPNDVPDPLKAEHRVVDEERHRRTLLRRVRGASCDPGAQRTRFADALLKDLPIGRLSILHQDVMVHRRVVLPEGSMDLELVKEGVQSKCPGLVRDHGHTSLAEVARLHQLSQEARKCHGCAHILWIALVKHREKIRGRQVNEATDLGGCSHGKAAAQILPLLHHIPQLGRVRRRLSEELATLRVLDLLVRQRDL
mmetsp:Transcript_68294/g.160067  ORF Transcript_68294/g.160067 Transcript_68294/m.160067 type:complete len:277 (-) Transcript_68294:976-1806(-)